jgi:hypothetical protein
MHTKSDTLSVIVSTESPYVKSNMATANTPTHEELPWGIFSFEKRPWDYQT